VPSLVRTYPAEAAWVGGNTRAYVVVVADAERTTCPDVEPSIWRPPPPSSRILEAREKSIVASLPLIKLKSFE
jgi:hypothetical protein